MRITSVSCVVAILAAVTRPAAPLPAPANTYYSVELFAPNVISTRDYERDGAFSRDGKTFYFTKRTIWPYFSAICVSHLRNGRWTEPEVAPFSGQYADATPSLSVDGSRLYFASRRPLNGVLSPVYNLWVVDRTGDAWSEPRALPAPINGHGSVVAPIETRNGSLYFLNADDAHVLVAKREGTGWAAPTPVGDANSPGSAELSAYVDPDERYMIVSAIGRTDALSTAEGIYGRADLYVRDRVGSEWSPLRHLSAPINTGADEIAPLVSPDGRYLYFTSERGTFTEHGSPFTYDKLERALHATGNGLGDIYRIDFRATGITR